MVTGAIMEKLHHQTVFFPFVLNFFHLLSVSSAELINLAHPEKTV